MIPSKEFFLASSLPVGHNVVKNILFRAATIVLEFVILKFLSFVAFKMRDYTSFLMFSEDTIQKFYYAISRRFNKKASLVLIFALFTVAAGFYDTLLWGLDFPGFVIKTTLTNAGQLSSYMLDSPTYITYLSNPLKNLDSININETLGANLFTTGLNFSLPGIITSDTRTVVSPTLNLSDLVSPRIWLDSEGFSVGIDSYIMLTQDMNKTNFCAPQAVDSNQQVWSCKVENSGALDLVDQVMGMPLIFWDTAGPTGVSHSEYLRPDRRDNSWKSIGAGSGTAVMKQLFTVSKGTTKHTFMETAIKTTMISFAPSEFPDAELTDVIRKTWSTDPGQPLTPTVQSLANLLIRAKNNGTSYTFGSFIQDKYSVGSLSSELLTVVRTTDQTRIYSYFQFSSTNITLLRSESLFNPPNHIATCDSPYSNLATGGVFQSVNCAISLGNQTGAHFFGEIDASSVLVMTNILGDGLSNVSATALDDEGIEWFNANSERIDQLVQSRGLILGGNRADVRVAVNSNAVAISYLQLLLVALPFALYILVSMITFRQHMSYFKNSFLAAVMETTHAGSAESDCASLQYMKSPPEVLLTKSGRHVLLGTSNGGTISINAPPNHLMGYNGLSYEPLLMDKEQGPSSPLATPYV